MEQVGKEEQQYDILILPGVPQKLIVDISEKFDVSIVERKEKIKFANMDGDERELLAFRGKKEILEQVEKYMIEQLNDFVREK
jgi:hypothetical protein